MPLFGSLDVAASSRSAPTVDHLAPDPWPLPGADVLQVSYEVREGPALAITPPALHPSIPPYATFSVLRCPQSPVGPFHLAMVRLIVRAGIRPRGLLVASFTDNPDAADALARGWGYRVRTAEVSFLRRHDLIRGTVAIDGAAALDIGLADPEPVAGADLELFDNLHLVNVSGQDPVIVQVDPTYVHHAADRGRADLATFDATALGANGVEPVYRVIAVAARVDIELGAPRFVMDPVVPAIQSTRRLQAG
jgi:hypothetical protein